MAARPIKQLPLVVIAGPTASGKTALAIELAEEFGGEVICADSRTVYKGMDIGTAKPTLEDRRRVAHWGLDLLEPGEQFTVADFKTYAEKKIEEIRARRHVPFLVGGTGLYIDAILFDYQFGNPSNQALRQVLEKLTIKELHDYCLFYNILLPENIHNKRYVIRAIEQKDVKVKRRVQPIRPSIIVGVATSRDELRKRIEQRSEQLFGSGVVEEATLLGKKYGWNNEAMTGVIYPLIHRYLKKGMPLEEVKEKFTTHDWQLAKRQLTWFRRNSYVQWFDLVEAKSYITHQLVND